VSSYVTSPIPGADIYAQSAASATKAYQNTLARLNQQRVGTLQQYGYQGTVDPTSGTITGMHVDPMNQYGNLQSMLRTQAQQSEADKYAAEDRGLIGGLANQAQSADKYNFGQQSAQLGQSLTDAISGYQDQQNQAAYARDQALADAEMQQLMLALQGGNFDTPNFDNPSDPSNPSNPNAPSANAKAAAAKIVAKKNYNPYGYVPGGSSTAVAKAIVAAATKPTTTAKRPTGGRI